MCVYYRYFGSKCVDAQQFVIISFRIKFPTLILGSFKNLSDEHLDTSIVAKKIRSCTCKQWKSRFCSRFKEREEIRKERVDQLEHASEETAKV